MYELLSIICPIIGIVLFMGMAVCIVQQGAEIEERDARIANLLAENRRLSLKIALFKSYTEHFLQRLDE